MGERLTINPRIILTYENMVKAWHSIQEQFSMVGMGGKTYTESPKQFLI